MLVYYGMQSALLLALSVPRRLQDVRRRTYSFLFLFLLVFVSFRFEVGCDWYGYLVRFVTQQHETIEFAFRQREPGFWLLTYFVNWLQLPYTYLNVFSASIFFAGLHAFARSQPDPLSFLVLCFPILIMNMPMSGIRQGAAIGLLCVAFLHFSQQRLLRFGAWTLLAGSLHAGSLVFLGLSPLVRGRVSSDRIALAVLLGAPFLFLGASTVGEVAVERYVGTDTTAEGAIFRAGLLFLTGLFFFILLRRPWKQAMPDDYKLANIGSFLMLGPLLFLPLSSVISDRMGYFLVPIQAAVLARSPYLLRGAYSNVISAAPYVALTATFVVWTQLSTHFAQCYVPYSFQFP